MRINYKKLWILLIKKDITPVNLRKDLNIATGTMTKLRRNEEVAISVHFHIFYNMTYLNSHPFFITELFLFSILHLVLHHIYLQYCNLNIHKFLKLHFSQL